MKRLFTIIISSVVLTMLHVSYIYADVTWDYNSTTHTLIISGQGVIDDYDTSEQTPWHSYIDDITTVVVNSGVERIGDNAFAKFSNLKYLSLPSGLLTIGDYAFAETAVEQLVIPSSVTTIGGAAFLWCDKLRTIYLGGSITRLGSTGSTDYDYGAFAYCDAVSDIYFYQSDISSITWNNRQEFKDNQATKVHVYESAALPTGLNCNFIRDIGNDLRSIGQSDMSDPDNPYEISYKWQLDFIIALINSTSISSSDESHQIYLKLMKDLEYDATEENNFTPIGNENRSFYGVFDGNGHAISGININSIQNYVGIFPYLSGTVKNTRFENIHIKTSGSYAGVFGAATYSTIENITVENSTFEADNCVGPLVGLIEEGTTTVRNCHVKSNVKVSATHNEANYSDAGGLVGRAGEGNSISGCSSAADVSGLRRYVAGLVGNNRAALTDCIYLGTSIKPENYRCAVSDNPNPKVSVNNCFYTSTSFSDDKALLAYQLTLGKGVTLTNPPVISYGTTDFPGITSYDGMILYDGIYYAPASTSLTFSNQDVWYLVNDKCVRTNTTQMPGQATLVNLYTLAGTGTEDVPYLISNTDDLDFLAKKVNSGNFYSGNFFKLGNDITYDSDALTIDNNNDGNGDSNYIGIGGYFGEDRAFLGHFDGQGYAISGIRISKSGNTNDDRNQGLFGHIGSGAEVKNVILADAAISGFSNTGGIVGRNEGGTISHCHTLDDVTVSGVQDEAYYLGGIVGYNYGGTVSDCTSAANITAANDCQFFGGIVGYNQNNNESTATVSNCLYLGSTLAGSKSVGAVVGYNYSDANIENCYYTSTTLKGKDNTGASLRNDASAIGYPSVSTGQAPQDNADNSAFLNLMTQRYTDLTAVSRTPSLNTAVTLALNNRTLWKDGKWNTLCLPFTVSDFSGTPLDGAIVKTLESATFSGGTLTLNFSSDQTAIEAGLPYIVMWSTTGNHAVNPVFTNVTITGTTPTDVTGTAANFHGIYNPYSTGGMDNSMLYLAAGNNVYYPEANMTICAFRAYFTLNGITAGDPVNGINNFVLNFGEESTSLSEELRVKSEKFDAGWYSIDGRKISGKPTENGVYINNGKKIIIK